MFETLGVSCARGQKAKGRHVIGELRNGAEVTLAVRIVNGAKDGPVVSLTGMIHGDEPVGWATINRLFDAIDPQELSGTLVGFPMSNPFAVITKSRTAEVDYERLNLNRVFPGNPEGLISERVAAAIFEGGIRKANYHIDFHEGGYDFIARYLIAQDHEDQPEISAKSLELAKSFGMGVPVNVLAVTPEAMRIGRAGTSTGQASAIGVPALTVELGGAGRVWPDHAEDAYQGTLNVLKDLGMVPGEKVTVEQEQHFGYGSRWPRPTRGGLWEQIVGVGDIVEEGQKVGHVKDALGDIIEELYAPFRAVVFDIRNTALIMTGEWTVHCGRLKPDAKSEKTVRLD